MMCFLPSAWRTGLLLAAAALVSGCNALPKRAHEAATERWNLARARGKAQLAAEQLAQGKVDEAAGALNEARQLAPDVDDWAPLQARVLMAQGRASEAEALLRRASLSGDSEAEGKYLLGAALEQEERFDEALAAYREAVELGPNQLDYVVVAAQVALQIGNIDAATEVLAIAAPRFSWSAAYQGVQAECCEQRRDWTGAATAWRRVLEDRPTDADVRMRLVAVLATVGFCGEARDALRELPPEAQKTIPTTELVRLAECFVSAGQPAAAVEFADRATAAAPEDPRPLRLLARALGASDDARRALAPARRALSLEPEDVATMELVAGLAWRAGDTALAQSTVAALLRQDPASSIGVYLRDRLTESTGPR